jgi:hypothetical protein
MPAVLTAVSWQSSLVEFCGFIRRPGRRIETADFRQRASFCSQLHTPQNNIKLKEIPQTYIGHGLPTHFYSTSFHEPSSNTNLGENSTRSKSYSMKMKTKCIKGKTT